MDFLCDRIEHFFKERTDLHFNGILPKGKYDHCVWTYWICIADQDFCKGHEFFHWFFYVKSKVCTKFVIFSRNIYISQCCVIWRKKKLINFHSLSALSAHFWRLCHNELSTKKKDVKHQNSFYYITLKPHKTCLLLALKHELIGGSVLLRRHTVWKFEIFSQFSVKSILPNS